MGQKVVADLAKQVPTSSKSTFDSEDQLVMETKLKIIEILQVSPHYLFTLSDCVSSINLKIYRYSKIS